MRVKLNKNLVARKRMYFTDKFITNSHWMLKEDMVDYSNIIANPKDSSCDLLDKFYESEGQIAVDLKQHRNNFYITKLAKSNIKTIDNSIPKPEDVFEKWEEFPALFPYSHTSIGSIPFKEKNYHVRFHCFLDGKVYVRYYNYSYYRELANVGLEIVPNIEEGTPSIIRVAITKEIVGAIMGMISDNDELSKMFERCKTYDYEK